MSRVIIGGGTNAAYVFDCKGIKWTNSARLDAPPQAGGFGIAVALSADTALVGAPDEGYAGVESGAAYTFFRRGNDWSAQEKLLPSDPRSEFHFGAAVALTNGFAVVGVGTSRGDTVYVFSLDR